MNFKNFVPRLKESVYNVLFPFDDNLLYVTTRSRAVILSSLGDGGELSLMNGDNNPDRINLPRLWLLFLRKVTTYRVTS